MNPSLSSLLPGAAITKKTIQIPDKLYFKIGEVAKLIGVETHVLRYWETVFPQIAPVKSRTQQRLYKRADVETIVAIRDLLYDQKFTIDGARRRLKEIRREARDNPHEGQITLDLEPSERQVKAMERLRDEVGTVIAEMDEFLKKKT